MKENKVMAEVVRGYGIASGKNFDARFPKGTIAMQQPFMEDRGLDLSSFHLGTLNIDITPSCCKFIKSSCCFKRIRWSNDLPPETFSFYPCKISLPDQNSRVSSLIYYPHPSTKPGFHQKEGVLEILAPYLKSVSYGSKIIIHADSEYILFTDHSEKP
ncbi:MAG TPA: hypothetical protein DHU78_00255 [Opitutae bacterium]|nr:hypothetical protein [Opitutae bacterium]